MYTHHIRLTTMWLYVNFFKIWFNSVLSSHLISYSIFSWNKVLTLFYLLWNQIFHNLFFVEDLQNILDACFRSYSIAPDAGIKPSSISWCQCRKDFPMYFLGMQVEIVLLSILLCCGIQLKSQNSNCVNCVNWVK